MTDKDAMIEAVARAVMVCNRCEGEGGYADGLDEAACSTECTLCGGNGWIVDLTALEPFMQAREQAAREEGREAEWNAVTEYIDGQITAWFSMGPPDKREWRALTMLNATIARNEHREQQDG